MTLADATLVELIDLKGDYWCLDAEAIQIDKRDGLWYVFWYVVEGPYFLQANGANYEIIFTPVFTEWF